MVGSRDEKLDIIRAKAFLRHELLQDDEVLL